MASPDTPVEDDMLLAARREALGEAPVLTGDALAARAQASERELIVEAVIAQSERDRLRIWPVREHIETALRHDPVFVYDIGLPISSMAAYPDTVEGRLRSVWPAVHCYCYGHLADGNLHLLVAPDAVPPTVTLVTAPARK